MESNQEIKKSKSNESNIEARFELKKNKKESRFRKRKKMNYKERKSNEINGYFIARNEKRFVN